MQIESWLGGGVTLMVLVVAALGMIGLTLHRRFGVCRAMIAASFGMMLLYDAFSIAAYQVFDQTTVFIIIMTTLEELIKFIACRFNNILRPAVRVITGFSFGLLEILVTKAPLIFWWQLNWGQIALFTALSLLTCLMHGITPLYYRISPFAFLGIAAGTAIYLAHNAVAQVAPPNAGGLIAVEQIVLLLVVVGVYRYLLGDADQLR